MTSVELMSAEQPRSFHVEPENTFAGSGETEFDDGLAKSGFLMLPSLMEGFVQTGAL